MTHPFSTSRATSRRLLYGLAGLVLLLAAGLALPALAQPGGSPQGKHPAWAGHEGHGARGAHRLERLARVLDLSESQIAQARALHEAAREEAEPIREASRELRADLAARLDAASPDPTGVGEVVIALRRNRESMKSIHEETKAAFEAILTPAQREKLATLEDAREELGRRGRGPRGHRFGGGHGGPGGGPPAGLGSPQG